MFPAVQDFRRNVEDLLIILQHGIDRECCILEQHVDPCRRLSSTVDNGCHGDVARTRSRSPFKPLPRRQWKLAGVGADSSSLRQQWKLSHKLTADMSVDDRPSSKISKIRWTASTDRDKLSVSQAAIKWDKSHESSGDQMSQDSELQADACAEEEDYPKSSGDAPLYDAVPSMARSEKSVVKESAGIRASMRMSRYKSKHSVSSNDFAFKEFAHWSPDDWTEDYETSVPATIKDFDNRVAKMLQILHDQDSRTYSRYTRCNKLHKYIMPPTSQFTVLCDAFFMMLIMYDCIQVPMLFLSPGEHLSTDVMGWVSRISWTLAIPRAFFTGYIATDGSIETRPPLIAVRYARTWMAMDIFIVVCDWIENSTGGILKMMRLLKAARLARMLSMPHIIMKRIKYSKTEMVLLYMNILQNALFFILLCHFVACIWFGIGNIDGSVGPGWVTKLNLEDADIIVKYTYAAHWSASQFIGSSEYFPENEVERGFSVLVMIFAFIWSASFISKLSASMTRLQILSSKKGIMFSNLRHYLSHHRINDDLAMRVTRCAKHFMEEKERNQDEADVELLKIISEPLQIEIHYDVHCHVLCRHPFFKRYNHFEPQAVMRLCHLAVSTMSLGMGDVLFSQGEEPANPNMFFILGGTLLYMKDIDKSTMEGNVEKMQTVVRGAWLCEPALWMHWVHVGSLRAATNSSVLALCANTFKDIVTEYRQTPYPAQYASAVAAQMTQAFLEGDDVDDMLSIVEVSQVCARVFPHALLRQGDSSGHRSGSSGQVPLASQLTRQETLHLMQDGLLNALRKSLAVTSQSMMRFSSRL